MKGHDVSAAGAATVGTGAVLTAAVAGACCVGPALAPLFVTVLGAGGLAAVAGLRPYSGWLLILSALMLAYAFCRAFGRPDCAADGVRAPWNRGVRIARVVLGVAGAVWVVSAAYAIYGLLYQ